MRAVHCSCKCKCCRCKCCKCKRFQTNMDVATDSTYSLNEDQLWELVQKCDVPTLKKLLGRVQIPYSGMAKAILNTKVPRVWIQKFPECTAHSPEVRNRGKVYELSRSSQSTRTELLHFRYARAGDDQLTSCTRSCAGTRSCDHSSNK